MEATGSFTYRLDFKLDIHQSNDMVFESNIDKDNLRISRYGAANLSKLNESFMHTPYEKGRAMRSFMVGVENPNFVSYEMISPFVKNAILTTEDPSFMHHRGFVNEAFRQSIAKNIRAGKFARGASTISMQLIKNVFLTRDKTMARKLEEILLVYMIENNYIVSKSRMFEVYLNLIEWGPNVYGIGEAARFYFQKSANELNLNEALYLASIVPSPKGFMYKFDKDGTIRPYMEKSFKFIANKMVSRSLIVPEDTIGINYKVNITGAAKTYIFKNDSIVTDSMIIDENGIIESTEEK
jgi:membrane peptidoglycan carboxypeptidase